MKDLKYLYAYDQYNNLIFIDDAFKNNYGQEYYLLKECQCRLVLADGIKNQKHFRIKSDAAINGNIVSLGSFGESVAHHNAKMEIIKNGFFDWNNYRIVIQNPIYEHRFEGGKFIADLYGELLCGTKCIIEIIISSKVSEKKRQYIEQNEILTFEIYFDKNGSKINEQFDCYGNGEIEGLKKSILEYESRVEGLRRAMPKKLSDIRREYDGKLEAKKEPIREEINRIDKFIGIKQMPIKYNESEIVELEESCKGFIRKIRERRLEIQECTIIYKRLKIKSQEMDRFTDRIRTMEQTFIQASKMCKSEWFGNKPKGLNDYQFIKYMTE